MLALDIHISWPLKSSVRPCLPVPSSRSAIHPSFKLLSSREAAQVLVRRFISLGLAFKSYQLGQSASRTVVSPLERLKIIQQVQPRNGGVPYKGVWSSLVRECLPRLPTTPFLTLHKECGKRKALKATWCASHIRVFRYLLIPSQL